MKRWLYLHLTWQGREERRLAKRWDEERAAARAAWADSPVRTCPHQRRARNGDATTLNRWNRCTDRYDYYEPEVCLDCGTGLVKVRRKAA